MNFRAVEFMTSCGVPSQLGAISGSHEIVFCGRSNAGKSTLLNKLCGRNNLARVSSTPGKTATINFFTLGEDFMLVDLPGYGFANRSFAEKERWADLMESYFSTERNIGLSLVLMDCRHDPSADDMDMIRFLNEAGYPYFAVLTKTDKLKKSQLMPQLAHMTALLQSLGAKQVLPFSQNDQQSHETLRKAIEGYFFN